MPSYECALCGDDTVFKDFPELAEHALKVHGAGFGNTAVFEERWLMFESTDKDISTVKHLMSVELREMERTEQGCSSGGKSFSSCADCKYEPESGGCVKSLIMTGRSVTYLRKDLK